MEKKKKGVMQSIPGWAWVLISLAAAILLWYALSINPKTAQIGRAHVCTPVTSRTRMPSSA